MSLNRFYKVFDMGHIVDELEPFDSTHHYEYTGTVPSWFNKEQLSILFPTFYFPSFTFKPPQGTSGTSTFGIKKYEFLTGTLVDSGIITINVQELTATPWIVDFCHTANLVWLDPSGGWESYLFSGKQQTFQDKGNAASFIKPDGQKRWHRKDEIHQGVIASTGNIPPAHIEFLADLHKSIQVYLWTGGNAYEPIIINPSTFKRVKTYEPYGAYEFEFRYATEDIIQTQ